MGSAVREFLFAGCVALDWDFLALAGTEGTNAILYGQRDCSQDRLMDETKRSQANK